MSMDMNGVERRAKNIIHERENGILYEFIQIIIVTLYILMFYFILKAKIINAYIILFVLLPLFFIGGYYVIKLSKKTADKIYLFKYRYDKEYILAKEIIKKYEEKKKLKEKERKLKEIFEEEQEKSNNIKDFENYLHWLLALITYKKRN